MPLDAIRFHIHKSSKKYILINLNVNAIFLHNSFVLVNNGTQEGGELKAMKQSKNCFQVLQILVER
jgi:hypothetical protein